jgi:hypothetical protein
MKTKFTLALSFLLCVGMAYDYNTRMAQSSSSGAPAGNTGDPSVSSGQTCGNGGCHSSAGIATGNEVAEITSNIPQEGYTPGQTYDMTVTLSGGGSKFGFSLSAAGNAGTLIAGSNTQLNGSGSYVTHTFNSNTGSGGITWNFQWTAPQVGTGAVTFYSAAMFANGNGGNSGDVTIPVDATFQESTGVGISEAELESLSVYPNPVIDEINVAAQDVDEEIMFTLFNTNGQVVLEEKREAGEISIDISGRSLSTGVYFLKMEVDGSSTIKKLLVK